MRKIRQRLARNELSRGQQHADKAMDSGGLEADGAFENAYEKFSSAATLDPKNAEIFHFWGLTLCDEADRKEGKEARDLYKAACEKLGEALTLDPNNAKVMNDWGAILMKQAGNKPDSKRTGALYQEAEEKILAANALEAGIGAYNLACLYSFRDKQGECRTWLEQARETGNLPGKGYLKADKDLDNVRDRSWFQEFMKVLSEKAEADIEAKEELQIEEAGSKKTHSGSWWRRLKRS